MRTLPVCLMALLLSAVGLALSGCTHKLQIAWTPSAVAESKAGAAELQVYLENSGSMDGYMVAGSELKDALYGYVSLLSAQAEATHINYINTTVVPFSGGIKQFVDGLTPGQFANVAGSRAHSDLGDMLQMVVGRMKKNSVALFVSDCILDVPQGDATNYFTNRRIQIESVVARKLRTDPNFSVEVLRLESRFNGYYYDLDGKTRLNVKSRPYYMIVMGSRDVLRQLNRTVPTSRIPHGYTGYVAYTTPRSVAYTFANQYGKEGKDNTIELTPDHKGNYRLRLLANLADLLVDGANPSEPSLLKPTQATTQVEDIAPIKNGGQYSHAVDLKLTKQTKAGGEMLSLQLATEPAWVAKANDETGRNIRKNLGKTSGIKYIIGGLADAYAEHTVSTFKFTITKQ